MPRMPEMTRRRFLGASMLAALGVGLGLSHAETRMVEVTRLSLGLGSRLVLLADPHIHGYGELEEKVVRLVEEAEPDVVMLAGDLVDELTADMSDAARFVSRLDAREKFVVLGNHEHWSGKAAAAARLLKDRGFRLLLDSAAPSSLGTVYGLDWREDRRYPPMRAEGIVLAHDPNAAVSLFGNAIVLAGHTHGGLVVAGVDLYSNSLYTRGL